MRRFLLSLTLLLTSATFLFAQNSCGEALPLTEGTYTVNAVDGTPPTEVCIGSSFQTAGEWYTYTTGDATELFSVTSNLPQNTGIEGLDTRLHLYKGTCATLECVDGNDDVDSNRLSELVDVILEPNTTYYIVFDNVWSSLGFDFEVSSEVYGNDCVTSLPFTDDFSDPTNFNYCYTVEDIDGNNQSWVSVQNSDLDNDGVLETFARDYYGGTEENDYLISPAFQLNGSVEYGLTAHFTGYDQEELSNQYLTAVLLDAPNASANVVTTIFDAVNVPNGDVEALEMDAIEQTATFTPDADGTYYVAFISTTQAPHTNGHILLFDYTLAGAVSVADEVVENASVVYPNPVKDIVNIRLSNDYDVAKITITLTNVSGKEVARFSNVNEINVANLSSGVYVMTITDGNKMETKKLVKK